MPFLGLYGYIVVYLFHWVNISNTNFLCVSDGSKSVNMLTIIWKFIRVLQLFTEVSMMLLKSSCPIYVISFLHVLSVRITLWMNSK